ncbi:hypothetical protein M2451_004109 [Dysgonomonas sp. PFB1-18]|uniref:hypothetical protein n=1 Tax=unclassified Dysgonomonas TaxID=2630389 RepID=UPI002474856C|nr:MULTISPECIES: hypothetical protein [unclassified Dysgonomonas]MDH6311178.1 hypothetical protein [Dysgonomonas sp. PF1-14]MDH6341062.1 hypothetical protein [Dysgonomonas sp. PF1-16]MDH6382759.1 hypothetical protein [Dysgonomonas sp. PFB1-18]MDH6400050.1 hypothetical protein [Dysgonomonas sp. PF1-23]
MKQKEAQQRQVIHVHILSTDEHYYFGSIQAVYDTFSKEQIGIAAQTLYNRGLDEKYVNDKAVIRKGILIQKRHSNN